MDFDTILKPILINPKYTLFLPILDSAVDLWRGGKFYPKPRAMFLKIEREKILSNSNATCLVGAALLWHPAYNFPDLIINFKLLSELGSEIFQIPQNTIKEIALGFDGETPTNKIKERTLARKFGLEVHSCLFRIPYHSN